MRLLIQVLPQLKPGRCGVSDQALLLAGELKRAFAIDTAFVVLNSAERCEVPYRVVHVAPNQLLATCQSLGADRRPALLVHLSGYGYAADGAPMELADALASVRADGRFHFAVYFHELFASSVPWRSAFWDRRRQRQVVCRIAGECDLLVTSIDEYARWLERKPKRHPGARIEVLSLFSAVGEAAAPVPAEEREPALSVFGLPGTRQRAYKELIAQPGLLRGLGVSGILDFGPGDVAPAEIAGFAVKKMGALSAAELAASLARIRFGYLSYRAEYLAKSSVFASYCAQGTIPVISTPFDGEPDGLKDGLHLITPRTLGDAATGGWQRCSQAAWQWYSNHRLRVHAEVYARWLDETVRARRA